MGDSIDHRHCKSCGRICAVDAETCSKACARRYEQVQRSRRLYTYLFVGMAIFVLLVFVSAFR